jgi:molecular chaperone HtpG
VAPDSGPDRQFEKLLSAAGRLDCAAKPILEINPLQGLVTRLAALEDVALRDDIAHLLLDEARVLDGERPADAQLFAARLGRLMASSLK